MRDRSAWRRFLPYCCAFALVSACATIGSFGSGAASYRSWVEGRVETRRLYDRGKQLFAAKLLAADDALKARQEEVAPGYGFERRAKQTQFVMGVTAFSRRELSPADLTWQLGGQAPVRVAEVRTAAVHERLYPYAYPFYRVFLVDFETTARGPFEIRSPYGRIEFDAETVAGLGASE